MFLPGTRNGGMLQSIEEERKKRNGGTLLNSEEERKTGPIYHQQTRTGTAGSPKVFTPAEEADKTRQKTITSGTETNQVDNTQIVFHKNG